MSVATDGGEVAPPNPIEARWEQAFPTLTPAQVARLEAHGKRIPTRKGQGLAEPGERRRLMFVVLSGSAEIARPALPGAHLLVPHAPTHSSAPLATPLPPPTPH